MHFSPLQGVVSNQLPNGLRILFKEDRSWPLLSLHAWVRVGSVDEEPSQAGIAHILEHMVFKGTAHYPAAEISRWIESLGGAINAETTKEFTHYFIDVPRAGARKAVELLGELLHRARLSPEEWRRERPVILEEIKRRNDDPETVLWDLLNRAIFQEEPLQRPVIGSPDVVARLDCEEIVSFYRRHYTAGRCLVVGVGDFKAKAMLSALASAFEAMPGGGRPARRTLQNAPYRPQHLKLKRPVRQAYIGFGFPTPPASHPDQEALDLLAAVLGEGRSSRLTRVLREQKKLAWSVSASNLSQEGPGVFAVFANTSPERRKRLRPALEAVVRSLRSRWPTAQELVRAKRLLQSAWLQSFETYHHQASVLGLYALDHQLHRLQTYLPRLLALNRTQLGRVMDRYWGAYPFSSAVVEG